MTEEKFDIRQWLLDVDTSRVDESLDEEAKRLLILNDTLTDPNCGPVLAALIVTAEEGCGLDAITELADCSEPRLAMTAIVNLLNVLENENLDENEFIAPDVTSDSDPVISLSRDDFPSDSFIRSKVAHAALQMSKFFIQRVEAGDFCPDFLTFLLTALMDISVQREGNERADEDKVLLLVPTESFLKTILRTWKTPDLALHHSSTMDEDDFSLGFLVTCYIRSLCVQHTEESETDSDGATIDESPQPTGVQALVNMGDWTVKFMLMRLYNSSVTSGERADLVSVLHHCGLRSEEFTDILIRESTLTAIWRISETDDASHGLFSTMSEAETATSLRTMFPTLMLLNHLSNQLLPDTALPGSGIWFENKQSRVTLWLCRALTCMVKQALRMVILSNFPATEEGHLASAAGISLASQLISHMWNAGIAVLFRSYRSPQRPLRAAFLNLFEVLSPTVEAFCRRRNWEWEEVSRLNRMTTLQVGVHACKALKRNLGLWEKMKSGEVVRGAAFLEYRSDLELCEWCLNDSDGLLMTCSKCRRVSYCSVEHQRAHWAKGHRSECRFFRNCLEGSSFSYGNGGKLRGLRTADDEDSDQNSPFGEFLLPQRSELLVLGYRMPGVLFERRGSNGTPEVLYRTMLQTIKTIAEFTFSQNLPLETTVNNLLIVESLMSTSRDTASLLHLRSDYDGDGDESRTFSLHCATSEYSQSLSVRLLP